LATCKKGGREGGREGGRVPIEGEMTQKYGENEAKVNGMETIKQKNEIYEEQSWVTYKKMRKHETHDGKYWKVSSMQSPR
jgi:hypothetical protein